MAIIESKKKELMTWVKESKTPDSNSSTYEFYPYDLGSFDKTSSTFSITIKIMGTKFEGRPQTIEMLSVGNDISLVRDAKNEYDSNCIGAFFKGMSIGNLPAELVEIVSPLIDSGTARITAAHVARVTPASKLDRRKAPEVYVEFNLKVENMEDIASEKINCILCHVGGDQTHVWAQKIRVLYCSIPISKAKLLFELYNRNHGEYDEERDYYGYAGLDNLEPEIKSARAKMRAEKEPGVDYSITGRDVLNKSNGRYDPIIGCLDEDSYEMGDSFWLVNAFENFIVNEREYFWLDETRVSKEEFYNENPGGFYHWYEVLELFEGNQLPVDFDDEDITSIFGTEKFTAFADLSYGC